MFYNCGYNYIAFRICKGKLIGRKGYFNCFSPLSVKMTKVPAAEGHSKEIKNAWRIYRFVSRSRAAGNFPPPPPTPSFKK
jgi:hypothetical protein